jgi:hypothetical protein
VIAEGVRTGDFRAGTEPEMTALAVLGMGNWIYQWYPHRAGWSAEEIGRCYGLMALRALTAKPRVVNRLADRAPDPRRDPVVKLLELRRAGGNGALARKRVDPTHRRGVARRGSLASASSN